MSTNPHVTAVVVAAGDSTRMGTPKQRLLIGGVPAFLRSLAAFEHCSLIRDIVLVTREQDGGDFAAMAAEYGISKLIATVSGGATRQQSVANGVAAATEADFIAIHDAARPLISDEVIRRVVTKAVEMGAATAAVKAKDTIKQGDKNNMVVCTPDRGSLWMIQTPQVFERRLYVEALMQASTAYTDDCQLMEHAGHPVALVEGDYHNIKLTTPEDAALANSLFTH